MRILLLVVLLAGFRPGDLGAAAPAAAAGPAAVSGVVTAAALQAAQPDSSTLHDLARDAQARFEFRRRQTLPRRRPSGGGGTCHEEVGRFCLRFGGVGVDDWTPRPDPPETIQAREDLLDTLAVLGRQIPGDVWIRGQRVHYLGEEGRWSEALELVGPCRGPGADWRCHALRGYVLHRSDRYREALDAFRTALDGMEEDRAERWRDIDVILDRRADDVWDDAPEERRELLRRRFWVLSDPLYLAPGNDRLSEHFARRASAWIREDARTPYGISWGWDLTELLVRYGGELGWERERQSAEALRSSAVIGHHHPESRQYVPPGRVFALPLHFEAEEWTLEPERPQASYAPAYAPRLEAEGFQVGVFRRGEEMIVVAGYGLPPDPAAAGEEDEASPAASDTAVSTLSGPTRAGLFLLNPDSAGRLQARTEGIDSGGLSLRAPAGRYMASMEVWSPRRARAARVRAGVGMRPLPPDVAALSDLLLLNPGDELPRELASAVPRVRARLQACPGETVAVGWEVYGLGLQRESVAFRLRLRRTDRGFFERAGEIFGLGGSGTPVSLEWTEPGPERLRPFFRAVNVTLPPDLEPGTYDLSLEVRLQGRSPLTADRALRVEEPEVCTPPGA